MRRRALMAATSVPSFSHLGCPVHDTSGGSGAPDISQACALPEGSNRIESRVFKTSKCDQERTETLSEPEVREEYYM